MEIENPLLADVGGNLTVPTDLQFTLDIHPAVQEGCGDPNDDGAVNVFDAIFQLQIIVGKVEPTEQQVFRSNVVLDDAINVFDVVLTLQHIVGKAEIVECGPI